MIIYPTKKTWIILLNIEKVFKSILLEYWDFINIFSKKSAAKLPKHLSINKYTLDLKKDKQLFYRPTCILVLVELKTLKSYIKNNLVNYFIQLSKSFIKISILFIKKLYFSFDLYINYLGLNNLTIKN